MSMNSKTRINALQKSVKLASRAGEKHQHDYLVYGQDFFSFQLAHELSRSHGEKSVQLLTRTPAHLFENEKTFSMLLREGTLFADYSFLLEENFQVPPLSITPHVLYFKDQQLKRLDGKLKTFTLLPGEEYFLKGKVHFSLQE